MSSQKRGTKRNKYDYYITPIKDIELFLNEFSNLVSIENKKILDPCAGGDDKNYMSYPKAFENLEINSIIDTIDIREDSRATVINNYLEMDVEKDKYDIIITNPPFNIAGDIIKKALSDVKDDGYVIMLLRLNYYGSARRKKMWENLMPEFTFIHHKRMSFTSDGKTDSIEYAHFVWNKKWDKNYSKTFVI